MGKEGGSIEARHSAEFEGNGGQISEEKIRSSLSTHKSQLQSLSTVYIVSCSQTYSCHPICCRFECEWPSAGGAFFLKHPEDLLGGNERRAVPVP